MPLQDFLTLDLLEERADPRTLSRGAAYFLEGKVAGLKVLDDSAQAEVAGTDVYHAKVYEADDGELGYECDCPVAQEGRLCKHVVAVGMAWLARVDDTLDTSAAPKPRSNPQSAERQIEAYLEGLGEAPLRALLQEAVNRDEVLREKLLMSARASSGKGLKSLRTAVKQATRTDGFLDWREAASYAYRLDDLAELLEGRIDSGDKALVPLIESAIAAAEEALQQIDDSNGEVFPAIKRLQEVHVAACNFLSPDPIALAARLFEYQMSSEWDTYSDVLPDYAEALGEEGVAAYRTTVERAWEALRPLTPADYRAAWEPKRHRIESAMESLAARSGDVETVLGVKAKNLSSPGRYLTLARLCRDHGRDEEALAWAEQGMAAFPNERIDDLTGFCIDAHLASGNAERVEGLAWARFEKLVGCDAFFQLLDVARKIRRTADLRDRALRHLWKVVADDERAAATKARSMWDQPKRGHLVSIYLREGDAEKMWEAFCGGKCDVRLWNAVAALRGKTDHEEAIALYRRLLPHAVEEGVRGARYDSAFAVVKAIRALRAEHNQLGIFGDELAEIRLQWKVKRNFQKLLAGL